MIQSPCNRVCTIDRATNLCLGCGRTLAEIADWSDFSEDERRRIAGELPARLAEVGAAPSRDAAA